ncbi:MAG: class I SAM-dependent methyltransferase [Alphaproteobacteria bacterium]|nr:class I SAM-dependent methyltransferase [Alphaproteobacteria bacterium]
MSTHIEETEMSIEVIEGYEASAAELIPRYESIPTDTVLGPILDALPGTPCRVLDVGAGAGRNPAWFAEQGHAVTACEPVDAFREAASHKYADAGIRWLDAALPGLEAAVSLGETYDFVLLSAVWQHIELPRRAAAMATLRSVMAHKATLAMSVRHGPGAAGRPVFGGTDKETQALAHDCGLTVRFTRHTASIQAANKAAGVTWSWMVFDAP